MNKYILGILSSFLGFFIHAQSIQGTVKDGKTKETLPFTRVQLVDFNSSTLTNDEGEFEFIGKYPSSVRIKISLLGYETIEQHFDSEKSINILLQPIHLEFDEVEITANKSEIRRNNVGFVELKQMGELNELPKTSLGEMLEEIEGVYNSSTGNGISKPVIRGFQGTRVSTLLNGIRLEGQQWSGDHGLGTGELGIGSVGVIKGPAALQYSPDALGGILYLSNLDFEKQNHHSVEISSHFESNTLGTMDKILYNGSLKNLSILAGAYFSNQADYKIPDGHYISNSRFQNLEMKFAIGGHIGNWVSNFNYNISTARFGIPGHTHGEHEDEDEDDHDHEDEEFYAEQQNRNKIYPVQNLFQQIATWENKFVFSKHKIQILTAVTHNNLEEYEPEEEHPEMAIHTINFPYKINVESRLSSDLYFTYGLQGMYLMQKNSLEAEEHLLPNAEQLDNGLYFLTNWEIAKWKFQGGIRGDNRVISTKKDDFFPTPFSSSFNSLNFSFGTAFFPKRSDVFRLNISSGQRTPHLSELLSEGEHHGTYRYEIGNSNLKKEKALQFDLTYEHEGEHLSFILNPYLNAIENYIFLQPLDSFIATFQVFEYRQSKYPIIQSGADVGIHYHPHFAHFLHLESSFSYLKVWAEFVEALSMLPQPRLNNTISTHFESDKKWKLDKISLQHLYYFPQNQVSTFEKASADYSLLNLGVQFSGEIKLAKLKFQVGVKNATNTKYVNHLSHLKPLEIPNPGRSFYVKGVLSF